MAIDSHWSWFPSRLQQFRSWFVLPPFQPFSFQLNLSHYKKTAVILLFKSSPFPKNSRQVDSMHSFAGIKKHNNFSTATATEYVLWSSVFLIQRSLQSFISSLACWIRQRVELSSFPLSQRAKGVYRVNVKKEEERIRFWTWWFGCEFLIHSSIHEGKQSYHKGKL